MQQLEHIAVIGAGTMGSGIAQVCATSGFKVTLIDLNTEALSKAKQTIAASVSKLHGKGKLDDTARDRATHGIATANDLSAATAADLVIEAATENATIKKRIFTDLDRMCGPGVILASNTSSISITEIAAATQRPADVIGLHFYNPVPLMALIEVIRGLDTSAETVETAFALAGALGKTAVEAADYPGFIGNRILCPMLNEAIFALMEGVGTPEAIDNVLKLGMNFPMGPLTLADFIGLDVLLAILDTLYDGYRDPKYRAAPLLRKMVAAGHLGRKTGRGFFTYDGA